MLSTGSPFPHKVSFLSGRSSIPLGPRSFSSILVTEDLLGEHDGNLVLRRDGEGDVSVAEDLVLQSNELGDLRREGKGVRHLFNEICKLQNL